MRSSTAALVLAALVACKERAPASGTAAAPATGTACDALTAGAGAARFAPHFPVETGGAVLVVRGDRTVVAGLMDSFGLAEVQLVACAAGELIVFVPAMGKRGLSELAGALVRAGATSEIREGHVFPPQGR